LTTSSISNYSLEHVSKCMSNTTIHYYPGQPEQLLDE